MLRRVSLPHRCIVSFRTTSSFTRCPGFSEMQDDEEIPNAHAIFKMFSIAVQQKYKKYGVCRGEYFCTKCKFFNDHVSKNQYHCDGCGICRTGGELRPCYKCGVYLFGEYTRCCDTKSLNNS